MAQGQQHPDVAVDLAHQGRDTELVRGVHDRRQQSLGHRLLAGRGLPSGSLAGPHHQCRESAACGREAGELATAKQVRRRVAGSQRPQQLRLRPADQVVPVPVVQPVCPPGAHPVGPHTLFWHGNPGG